ncbi:hypothetical protein L916_04278 [Phytophthora nicotianae]|uniref:Calponin-homology (CH) domain-containing protein n=1 Tax=Phytophthora nicotianae TaxID=4792 RepID=W2JGU0_PHYNI|nr:hypothetical protein L916_04278 [Phytophthora nicotianae]
MDRSVSASLAALPSSRSHLLPVKVRKPIIDRTTSLPSSPQGNQQSHKRPLTLNSPNASSKRPPLLVDTRSPSVVGDNSRRKARPSTAAVTLSSTEILNKIIGTPEDAALQQQTRPESAPIASRRASSGAQSIAPLKVNSAWSASPSSSVSSSRCAGCGGFAEMCLSCFTQFKQQDGARYKTQLVQAVDSLFAKATTRAFRRMAAVVVQWVFQAWKAAVRRAKWKTQLTVRMLQKQRMRQLWKSWQIFIYERRIIGAMLYAESQQRETKEKAHEVAKLHGDGFERESAARVHEAMQREIVQKLEAQLAALKKSMQAKDRELRDLRRELREKHALVNVLQAQVVNPQEVERLRVESTEYKKASFQLVAALTQSMETQLEVLSTSEGRQNLSDIFTRDLTQSLDKPEHSSFYNPLVDMEAAEASNEKPTSFVLAYEAPVDRAEAILTQWVNSLIARQPPDWLSVPRMQNFHSSLTDGKLYAVVTKLLHAAMCRTRLRRPAGGTASRLEATSVLRENGEDLTEISMERYLEHIRHETSIEKRLEVMINTLGQAMWLPLGLLNAKDIRAGHVEFNFAALTYLFVTFSPCLAPDYYSLCTELTQQLEDVKTKWQELQGDGTVATDPTTGEELSLSMQVKLALSQTLELKRRIDTEDLKSREGHALWVKAERIVMRKCFLSYARLARGKTGVLTKTDASLRDENEAFAKLPKHKLQDLALPYEDFNWEAKLLQSYLVTIYCDLARIYRGYATRSGGTSNTINVGVFIELLTECHVLEGNMTNADLQNIIRALDPKTKTVNAHRALPPMEFLEALVRVGRKKYPVETNRVTISEAFCLLVDNFILPFAFRSDADLFRQQIEDTTIHRLRIKYTDDLKKMYEKYAVEDPKHKNKNERVTAFTFSQCLLDRGVLDMTLTSDKILGILSKVLRNSKSAAPDTSSSSKGGRRAGEDEDVTYPQFEEALIAVACHKFPDPYVSLESRVEKFFSVYVRERRE